MDAEQEIGARAVAVTTSSRRAGASWANRSRAFPPGAPSSSNRSAWTASLASRRCQGTACAASACGAAARRRPFRHAGAAPHTVPATGARPVRWRRPWRRLCTSGPAGCRSVLRRRCWATPQAPFGGLSPAAPALAPARRPPGAAWRSSSSRPPGVAGPPAERTTVRVRTVAQRREQVTARKESPPAAPKPLSSARRRRTKLRHYQAWCSACSSGSLGQRLLAGAGSRLGDGRGLAVPILPLSVLGSSARTERGGGMSAADFAPGARSAPGQPGSEQRRQVSTADAGGAVISEHGAGFAHPGRLARHEAISPSSMRKPLNPATVSGRPKCSST